MLRLTDEYHFITTWGNYRGACEEGLAHAGFKAEHKPHFIFLYMIRTLYIVGGVHFILIIFNF